MLLLTIIFRLDESTEEVYKRQTNPGYVGRKKRSNTGRYVVAENEATYCTITLPASKTTLLTFYASRHLYKYSIIYAIFCYILGSKNILRYRLTITVLWITVCFRGITISLILLILLISDTIKTSTSFIVKGLVSGGAEYRRKYLQVYRKYNHGNHQMLPW